MNNWLRFHPYPDYMRLADEEADRVAEANIQKFVEQHHRNNTNFMNLMSEKIGFII